jgi:hypothetical protein
MGECIVTARKGRFLKLPRNRTLMVTGKGNRQVSLSVELPGCVPAPSKPICAKCKRDPSFVNFIET